MSSDIVALQRLSADGHWQELSCYDDIGTAYYALWSFKMGDIALSNQKKERQYRIVALHNLKLMLSCKCDGYWSAEADRQMPCPKKSQEEISLCCQAGNSIEEVTMSSFPTIGWHSPNQCQRCAERQEIKAPSRKT